MVHGWTGATAGRSAERPIRSRTGNGRIVKEEDRAHSMNGDRNAKN